MKKRILALLLILTLLVSGCGSKKSRTIESLKLADGAYSVEVTLEGGTGRATIASPAELEIAGGKAWLTVVWSSPFYDYMKVDGTRYDFLSNENGSVFRIPVTVVGESFPVIADTVAMSTPHEIDYQLTLNADSIVKK